LLQRSSTEREKELDAVRLRPTPHEFELYFDVWGLTTL
jgi:hypothetical protein